eukprot:1570287-Amphidinium_carterae.1
MSASMQVGSQVKSLFLMRGFARPVDDIIHSDCIHCQQRLLEELQLSKVIGRHQTAESGSKKHHQSTALRLIPYSSKYFKYFQWN